MSEETTDKLAGYVPFHPAPGKHLLVEQNVLPGNGWRTTMVSWVPIPDGTVHGVRKKGAFIQVVSRTDDVLHVVAEFDAAKVVSICRVDAKEDGTVRPLSATELASPEVAS